MHEYLWTKGKKKQIIEMLNDAEKLCLDGYVVRVSAHVVCDLGERCDAGPVDMPEMIPKYKHNKESCPHYATGGEK